MKAIIFAAGKGTRLKPLTDFVPKALVPIDGKPLLEWLLLKLAHSGVVDVVVNVHHFSDQVIGFLNSMPVAGLNIQISDESDLLLDTGGGLKKAAPLLQGHEPILIHNVDIVSNLDFRHFEKTFSNSGLPAMLAVKDRETARKLVFDDYGHLVGWLNKTSGEHIAVNHSYKQGHEFAYSGIAMIGPEFLSMINEDGVFGLIQACLTVAAKNNIGLYKAEHEWLDVGKAEVIQVAETFVSTHYKKYCR